MTKSRSGCASCCPLPNEWLLSNGFGVSVTGHLTTSYPGCTLVEYGSSTYLKCVGVCEYVRASSPASVGGVTHRRVLSPGHARRPALLCLDAERASSIEVTAAAAFFGSVEVTAAAAFVESARTGACGRTKTVGGRGLGTCCAGCVAQRWGIDKRCQRTLNSQPCKWCVCARVCVCACVCVCVRACVCV
jgi:hypothetical protein